MMKESMIQVICGPGKGKSTSAMGRGISALAKGSNVIMVQFLKGSLDMDNMEILKRLEPEFKIFRRRLFSLTSWQRKKRMRQGSASATG